MLALTLRGLPRAESHELLRRITRDLGPSETLAGRARNDPAVTKWIAPSEVDRLLDPARYVEVAAAKTDRIVERLARELAA